MSKDELHISLSPPRLSALRDVSRMVEAFGATHRLDESRVYMLNLALDELITNSVNYGFDGVAEPRIGDHVVDQRQVAGPDDHRQRAPFRSDGEGSARTCRCRSRIGPPGGWDCTLVRTFADRVTYQLTEGENRLTLEHNHAPVERPEEADRPMEAEVAEERHDGVLVLSPVGRLDSGNVNSFEKSVMKRIGGGERRLIVDFSRLDFISSSGLRVLLLAAKALKAGSGTLVVCSMKPHIEEVFRLGGFERFIPVKATRAAALESCA